MPSPRPSTEGGESPSSVSVPARRAPAGHRTWRASAGVGSHQGRDLRVAWRLAWTRPHASNSAAAVLQRDERINVAELGFCGWRAGTAAPAAGPPQSQGSYRFRSYRSFASMACPRGARAKALARLIGGAGRPMRRPAVVRFEVERARLAAQASHGLAQPRRGRRCVGALRDAQGDAFGLGW